MKASDYKKSKSTVVQLSGRSTLISGDEDMGWLRDVHLPGLSKKFHSALIFGNEDSPDRIQVYHLENPNVYDQPVIYVRKARRR
jgi:hypothetical protein